MFITVFTTAHQLYLPCTRLIQSRSSHHVSLRSSFILLCRLILGLPSGMFPLGYTSKKHVCIFLLPHMCRVPHVSHSPWFVTLIISGESTQPHVMQLSLVSCYFLPVSSRYFPQDPIRWLLQPVLCLISCVSFRYQRKCRILKVFNCISFAATCFGHCCGRLQGVSWQLLTCVSIYIYTWLAH